MRTPAGPGRLGSGNYAFLLSLVLLFSGCSDKPATLVLGYSAVDPNTQVASAMAEVLQEAGLAVTLDQPFESAEELTAAVEGGAVDIAILDEPLAHNSNLRMLMPILPRVLHVLHHRSLGNPTLQQLLQADSIYAGQANSQGQTLIKALAEHHQVFDLPERLLDNPWVPSPGEPPQVYFIFGGLLSAEARLGFSDYRMFTFAENSGSSPDALALLYPNVRPFVLPRGIYPELSDTETPTLAVETLLVARPEFSSQGAYRLVQALYERPQPLEAAYALSRESFSQPMADTTHTLAMHNGSRRFVNKNEPSLLERYAEVFALLVALSLAIGTGITTWLRSRRQRRKDRLDEFFLRLQDLRVALHERDSVPIAERQSIAEATANVAALEAEVLQLLVEERLAVDSALVAFFLLSESVRRQLTAAAE